jgi:hypothetical protein
MKHSYYQIAPLPLLSAHERRRSELINLKDQTEAPFCGPNDCSAHARFHSLYDRTTAVSPRYADPFPSDCACNDGVRPVTLTPLAEA